MACNICKTKRHVKYVYKAKLSNREYVIYILKVCKYVFQCEKRIDKGRIKGEKEEKEGKDK